MAQPRQRDPLTLAAPRLGDGVLVSSASRKVPLISAVRSAVGRCAPAGKVFAGDADRNCLAAPLADGFWCMPPLRELALDRIVDWCREQRVGAIVPTRDGELAFWATLRPALADAGIAVMVSSPDCIARCTDKLLFAEFAASLPDWTVISTATDVAGLPAGTTRFVVKDRFGAGARGQALDVPREVAAAAAAALAQPVVQAYVAGTEVSADAYVAADSRCIGVVLRTRDVVVAGESQVTTTFRDAALEAKVALLAERLGISGHCVVQFIVTPDGEPRLLECNARFGGASTLAIAAGLRSFDWFLRECRGETVTPEDFTAISDRLRQVRHATDFVTRLDRGGEHV